MKTYLECIPCFFHQVLGASQLAGLSNRKKEELVRELAGKIAKFDLRLPPSELGREIYHLVDRYSNKKDIYKAIRKKSNQLAMKVYPLLKKTLKKSGDSLYSAIELAIAGNIIDYGAKKNLNIKKELKAILSGKSLKKNRATLKCYRKFQEKLKKAKIVLYLADNAGETVFDRIFIEQIKRRYPQVDINYAVRDKPIINDALLEDAVKSGVNRVATVVSSGSDAPGIILSLCNKIFIKLFNTADIIISKGQGNYEALSSLSGPIFYLLMIKCSVVAGHAKKQENEMAFLC